MDCNMKLVFLNGRGRAELIRYLLKLADKDFEDVRISLESWPEVKHTMPLGKVPVFHDGDKTIVQTMPIARYVARQLGLSGSSSWDQAICDMMCETGSDVIAEAWEYIYTAKTDEEKSNATEKVKQALVGFNKLVSLYVKGVFVLGDQPTLADAVITSTVEFVNIRVGDICSPFSDLCTISERFRAIPAIAEWIKVRPDTWF